MHVTAALVANFEVPAAEYCARLLPCCTHNIANPKCLSVAANTTLNSLKIWEWTKKSAARSAVNVLERIECSSELDPTTWIQHPTS